MAASVSKSSPTIGFVTVRDYEDLGLIGGYLVLNTSGRPREFHCTAPVRPNRAQEILYGPTLEPFLVGEQIASALVARGKESPLFVCTDRPAVLTLRNVIDQPVVLLPAEDPPDATGSRVHRLDSAHASPRPHRPDLHQFEFDGYVAQISPQAATDQELVVRLWQQHRGELDLREPFLRLAEAIEETQRGAVGKRTTVARQEP